MTEKPKTIICFFCQEEVDFTHLENQTYLDHLDSDHHIEYYRQLTLMLNLLDKNSLEYFSKMPPAQKPKTSSCLLCRKDCNIGDDKGDEFFNHLRNEHRIVSNLQLIKAINLMDNDGLRGIIKKFEEIYEVDDEDDNEENDEEKMLIEDGATFDDSKATAQPGQEEMYQELEEELITGSEVMNSYKSQSVASDMVEQTNLNSQYVNNQFESFFNVSNTSVSSDQINLMEDSTSNSFQSNSSLNTSINFPPGKQFDAVTKSDILNNQSYGESNNTPNIKRSKKAAKGETSDFSEAVRYEIEKGNLSTTMDIPFEQTLKVMKEITIMFMNGTECNLCDKIFKTKAHLHEHIESIHNPFKVYFCIVCQLPMTNSNKHRHHKKSKKCSTGQLQLKYLE